VDTNRCLNTKVFGGKDGREQPGMLFVAADRADLALAIAHPETIHGFGGFGPLRSGRPPGQNGTERGDVKHVTEEKRALPLLRAFFTCDTEEIDQDMLDKYRAYRKKNVKPDRM